MSEIKGEIGFGAEVRENRSGKREYRPIFHFSVNGELYEFTGTKTFDTEKEIRRMAKLFRLIITNTEQDNIHEAKEGETFSKEELSTKIEDVRENRNEKKQRPLYNWDDQDNTRF